MTCAAFSAAPCNGRGARKSTFARTSCSRCSSVRPVRSQLRWRSSAASAHGHGRPAPKCGFGSASIPVIPHSPTPATWGWQCTLRPAYALLVTAVKSCSRATRCERSRHRLLAMSAFAAWARTGSRAYRSRSPCSSSRRRTFRETFRHLGPQKGHSSLLLNQRSELAVQAAWLEHGLVRDRGGAVDGCWYARAPPPSVATNLRLSRLPVLLPALDCH